LQAKPYLAYYPPSSDGELPCLVVEKCYVSLIQKYDLDVKPNRESIVSLLEYQRIIIIGSGVLLDLNSKVVARVIDVG
jgi:hypothetical protein